MSEESLPWTIEAIRIVDRIHGSLYDAVTNAALVALQEADWPNKSGVVVHVKLTRGKKIFKLVFETPKIPKVH